MGVGAEGSVEKKYCYNVYFLGREISSKEIHFVVMKNVDVYTTVSYSDCFRIPLCYRRILLSEGPRNITYMYIYVLLLSLLDGE